MDRDPSVPDPVEGGDPRPGPSLPGGPDWELDEDGPAFAWLPPEDRLWRHPSERTASGPPPGGAPRSGPPRRSVEDAARRWASLLPSPAGHGAWAVALVAGLVGACAATGLGLAGGLWNHDTTVVRSITPATSSVSLADIGPEPTNWTAIDDSVVDSVVTVSVDGAAGQEMTSGLMFLQSADGQSFIVTDRAPFARGQAAGYVGQIGVTFLSGITSGAKLIGEDALSGLAVLEVSGPGAASAVSASLGTVADVHDAEQVLAVGSRALPSVSSVAIGTISSEDRTVPLADGTDLDGLLAVAMPTMNTTAAGGPILDQFGQVVGMAVSLDPVNQSDSQFTFAVPVDEVSRVATQMIDGKQLSHPWVGIANADDLPSVMAHQLGLDGGVRIGDVASGSPASRAGLRPTDILTSLDGKPIVSTGALVADISACTPGKSVPVTYVHEGRSYTTSMRVLQEPADS